MSEFDISCMNRAIELSRLCVSEHGKKSPSVGAVFAKDGVVITEAYRGELRPGEHAEFTAIKKNSNESFLKGATVYTTLEPCTARGPEKTPCADWLISKQVSEVVIGMLDPDGRIYNKGCQKLRSAGINVRFFPDDLRKEIIAFDSSFLGQFKGNPDLAGTGRFNYQNNNGSYFLGHGEFLFETKWSKCGADSIYAYSDGPSIAYVAFADGARDFQELIDATIFDASSRTRKIKKNQIAIFKNKNGFFAAVKVIQVFNAERGHDRDELFIEFEILADKSSDFSRSGGR